LMGSVELVVSWRKRKIGSTNFPKTIRARGTSPKRVLDIKNDV
jgi:hypothetical protein